MKNIFLVGLILLSLGTAFAESPITASGLVKDGITNQALPDAIVYLMIQSYTPADRQKIEYSARTTTDAEGKYQFELAVDLATSNPTRFLKLLVGTKGYIGTIDTDRFSSSTVPKVLQHNFALLAEGKEATVKGTVRDVVTRIPLSNIPVEVNLSESDYQAGNYIQKNKEIRKLLTDLNGIYETHIPAGYVDRIKAISRWWVTIQSPDYEIAAIDPGATGRCCSRDTTQPEPDQETNIAFNVTDYYLVSKTATGKLEGILVDSNTKPVSRTKIRIEIATGGGSAMSSAEGGFG